MKMTIESTTRIVNADGIDCRVWEGVSERGVRVQVLVPRIAAQDGQDLSQFESGTSGAESSERGGNCISDAEGPVNFPAGI
jgi:hypothetical protein